MQSQARLDKSSLELERHTKLPHDSSRASKLELNIVTFLYLDILHEGKGTRCMYLKYLVYLLKVLGMNCR